MALGDVLDVHDVQRPVHIGGQLAAHDAAHELGGGVIDIAGAEDEGGIDDHQRQPARGQAQRLHLGLVLGVHVGQLIAAAKELRLIGDGAARDGADGGDRGGVDGALHTRAQGLLQDDARPFDVDAKERVDRRPEAGRAGEVKDAIDAAHRAAHGAAVKDVAVDGLVGEGEVLEVGLLAHGQAQTVAARDEQTREVRTDEAGSTRQEGLGHLRQSSVANPRDRRLELAVERHAWASGTSIRSLTW
jgi:hypothetical protein